MLIYVVQPSGVVGGVLGFPALDHPGYAGDESLGWINRPNGSEYTALGVTLPRMDDARKANYLASISRYAASSGEFLMIDAHNKEQRVIISAAKA